MTRRLLTISSMIVVAASAVAQSQPTTSRPASAPASAAATSQSSASLKDREDSLVPGPKYAPMRYNDDFSYLDGGPGTCKPDLFDPLKRIRFGDDWKLSIGGEVRGRVEWETHKQYGNEPTTEDTFFVHRYYLNANLEYRKLVRLYLEGSTAFIEDRDGPTIRNSEDNWDASQYFVDFHVLGEDVPLTLRYGRFEMCFGRDRLIATGDWSNVRRAFEGVKLNWTDPRWDIDVWYTEPVVRTRSTADTPESQQHFWGIYSTYKGITNHKLDLYALAYDDKGDVTNSNLRFNDIGDLAVYTFGSRLNGRQPIGRDVWDYDIEAAYQFGTFSSDRLGAWMGAADTGYTFEDGFMKPRLGLGFDYASGDSDPLDDWSGTFFPLFGNAHRYFGWADEIGRRNVIAPNANITLHPHKSLEFAIVYYSFWAAEDQDGLYGTSGPPVRRRPYGEVPTHFGDELDMQLTYRFDAHTQFLFGWAHFWAGGFINSTGRGEDPDLFYVQYRIQF